MAYISNAKDYHGPKIRQQRMEENFGYWKSLGLSPLEIDLRTYFQKPGVERTLDGYEFIWLAGGNTFLLRRALKYTGIDEYLIKRVAEDSVIYGGESAGAIMATPTLRGSEDASTNEDNPNYAPKPYTKEAIWDGLGLIDYVVVPHYKTPGLEESIDGYVNYLKEHKIPFITIREDEAVLVNGDKEEFLK